MSLEYIPGGVAAVTPSDTVDLTSGRGCIGFRANVAGDVAFICLDNSTGTYTVAAGEAVHLRVKRIKSTGTTATGIYALYAGPSV